MKLFALITLTAIAANAATSINLDFGPAGRLPPSSYAAAGSAGTWNNVASLGSFPMTGFVDTTGNPIALSIASSRPLFAVTPSSQPFSGPAADLLGDYLVSTLNDFTLTFAGLSPGDYRIFTYTVGRQDFPRPSTVTPFGDVSLAAANTGIWAGGLQEGITHSVHDLHLASGQFSLDIFSSADGFVNGLQLVQVPEPSVASLLPLSLLIFGCMIFRQGLNMRCSCNRPLRDGPSVAWASRVSTQRTHERHFR